MRTEELESINSELFMELDLEDQQYLVGQLTSCQTVCVTGSSSGGYDAGYENDYDWS